MSHRIEPSRAALADFEALYDYLAREDPRTAAQVLRSLNHSILFHRIFLTDDANEE
jgi:plasmid stabilization system protein ParE